MYHWFNDSAFAKKGTQDLVLKTKFVSKDAALARILLFIRMNYYVQGEQRFVLQYFGDPSTALREEGQGFGPPASDSDPKDLIPRWEENMSKNNKEPNSGAAPATTDKVDKVTAAPETAMVEYTLSANPSKEELQAKLDALMMDNNQEHNEVVRERMRPAVPIQQWNPNAAVMSLKYAKAYLDLTIQAGVGIENARKCSIVNPQGGQVYVIATRDLQTNDVMICWQSHVLVKGLKWRQDYQKKDTFAGYGLERLGYRNVGNKYFHKWVFSDSQRQHVIVDYMGNASLAVSAQHGNDKSTNRPYTKRSQLVDVNMDKQQKLGKDSATEIYNAIMAVATAGEIHAISCPRNTRQVQHILD